MSRGGWVDAWKSSAAEILVTSTDIRKHLGDRDWGIAERDGNALIRHSPPWSVWDQYVVTAFDSGKSLSVRVSPSQLTELVTSGKDLGAWFAERLLELKGWRKP